MVQLPPSMLKRASSVRSSAMTAASRCRSVAGLEAVPDPCLDAAAAAPAGRSPLTPAASKRFEVLRDVHQPGRDPEHSRIDLDVLGRELVHHHAAVLAVGDLRDQRRDPTGRPAPRRDRPLAS